MSEKKDSPSSKLVCHLDKLGYVKHLSRHSRAGKNEETSTCSGIFEGLLSSKDDGVNKCNEITTLPELLAGLENDKRLNNRWHQMGGNTWNDERNKKRKLEQTILEEREDRAMEPNIQLNNQCHERQDEEEANAQWYNHCHERQDEGANMQWNKHTHEMQEEEAADLKSGGGLNLDQLCHQLIRQHLNTVRKGEQNDTREEVCGQDSTILKTHKAIITALCRSKSEVAIKDEKKGILLLQKPNIDTLIFAEKCSPHHHSQQHLFKVHLDAISKLIHDAVVKQELTQLPTASLDSDDSTLSSTSPLHSSFSASVPKEANQFPSVSSSSKKLMLSTRTRRIRSRMRKQTEKRHTEWCYSSSSSED